MVKKKKIHASMIVIWFAIISMGIIEYFSSNCIVQIIALLFTYFFMALSVKFDIFHPYVWFGGGLTLYSVGYPILYALGAHISYGYTKEPLFMSWIALTIIAIMVPAYSIEKKTIQIKKDISPKFLIDVTALYIGCCIISILNSGLTHKKEIYALNNIFYKIAFSGVYLLLVFYAYSFNTYNAKGKTKIGLIIEIAAVTVGLSLVSGERDIMFNFFLVTVLLLYYWNVINIKQLILVAILVVILFPLSHVYKYYFLTGELGGNYSFHFSLQNIIINFFHGEFESASKNLQILVNNEAITKGIMQGKTYISAIMRIFGFDPWSTNKWFMANFFEKGRAGQGFTVIGEGYINFGYSGIIFEFIIIGAILSYIYKRHNRSIAWLTIYISSFPIFIYAVRANLANIISPMCKHILLGIVIIKVYNSILYWEKYGVTIELNKQPKIINANIRTRTDTE